MKVLLTIISFFVMLCVVSCQSDGILRTQGETKPTFDAIQDDDLVKAGNHFYETHDSVHAIEVFDEMIRRNITIDEAFFKKGVMLHEQGKADEAVECLSRAVEQNPNHFKAYFNLGVIFYENRKFQKSLDSYNAANNLVAEDDQTIYGIAVAQFALHKYLESRANANLALKINPNNANARELMENLDFRK